jgi:hypothetical protein
MANEEFDYHKILADMEAKRDAMNAAIDGMRLMLGLSAGAQSPRVVTPLEVIIENGTFFGMSLPDAAGKYLRMTPKVLRTTKEIADALEAGGFETQSKRFFNTVFNSLTRYTAPEGTFVKVGGKWGLLEWYPDYKPKARRAGVVEELEDDGAEISEETGELIDSTTELSSTTVS